jgi:hypothetical protein
VRGLSPSEVPARLQRLAAAVKHWPHFAAPAQHASTTAHSVVCAATASEHAAVVRTWAAQEWAAWSTHHAGVARLAENCFVSSVSGA